MHIRRFNRQSRKKIIKVLFHLTSKIALLMWISRVLTHAFPPKSLEYGVMDCWFFNIFYVLCKFWKCKIRCFSVFMTYEPLRVQSLKAIRSEFTYSVVVATLVFWVNRSTDMYSLIINLSHTTLAKRRQRAKLLTSIN